MVSISSTPKDSLRPEPHFIYVYDPLCGWCYGFSPVITSLWEQYQNEGTLEVVSGGMMRGDRVGPVSEVAPYIREAYKTVEDRTGVKFGPNYLYDLLGEGVTIMDSEPSCLAQTAFRLLHPDKALLYASAVQKAIYYDGLAPQDTQGLIDLAHQLGADKAAFTATFFDPQTFEVMIADFNRSEGMGVTGFPTLFMELDDRRYVLSRGFDTQESISNRIEQILREEGLR